MKKFKERLAKIFGPNDRSGSEQQQQQQGQQRGGARSDGKPPRRPKAPMSANSALGSRASYDTARVTRPGNGGFGFGRPSGASESGKGELQQVDARSRRSMQGELEPDPRRGSISSVASGQENGPSNSQRKKGTADLKTAMLHQAPEAAAPSALEPHPEESDPSLVDRYLPAGRASLQGADGGFQGSYLPNQMPLQRAPSSIGRQDSGRQMHRANSGMSIMPPGSHISMTGSDVDLEGLAQQLQTGSTDERGAAAERLFSHAVESERARSHVAALGVVQPLVALLWDGLERGRMYAAYALSALMTPQSPVDSLLAAGVVPALLNVLQTSRALATKKGAMRALGRLARSDEAASELVAAEGLPPIIALLDCSDPGLVRRCLVALYFVGADKGALQAAIASAGAVAPAVRLCRSSHPEVQAEAADVLKVLARSPTAAQVIVDLDSLEVLNKVATNGLSTRSRTSAVKAIQRLAAHPQLAARVHAGPAGAHVGPAPLTRMGSGASGKSSRIMPVAAGVRDQRFADEQAAEMAELPLRVPAKGSTGPLAMQPVLPQQEFRGDAQGVGSVGPLVDMLGPEQDAQSRAYAARSLASMASPDRPAMAHAMLQLGAPEGLAQILRDVSSEPAACTSAALALETIASVPGAAQSLPHIECADSAQQALQHGPASCHAHCLRLQQLLLRAHISLGGHLLDQGALQMIIRRLSHGAEDVRLAALGLLAELAKLGLPITGCVPVVAVLERSVAPDVRGAAATVLTSLSSDPVCAAAVREHRELQDNVRSLLSTLRSSVAIPAQVEEAMRMVPRSMFLPPGQAALAWQARPVLPSGHSLILGSPQAEALALQAVGLEPGNSVLDVGSGSGYLTMLASHLAGEAGSALGVEIRDEAVDYAEGCMARLSETFSEATPAASFLRGNVFDHPQLAGSKFDRILVGAACPRGRLRDLLRLLRPGGKMAALCEGQLLLLAQPSAHGPISEPAVLGNFAAADSLLDSAARAPAAEGAGGPKALMENPFKRHAGAAANGHDLHAGQPPKPFAHPPRQANGHARYQASSGSGRSGHSNEDDESSMTTEEGHGWFISWEDIRICRNAEGHKCRLGEGGFGIVYKALMNGVDEVAVKLVKADQPSAREMALFHKEVRVLRKLHHRNIVQFYGACLEPGAMFFVTELMKGGDLYSALRHHADTMRWDRLGRKVATDVALGINYLHTRRPPMMHRDLKSPNVLLSEEGVAKIADVGMVRAQVQDLVTAQPVMTPLWAAPEVVRHERASIKADIWSYGILIWELISNQDITELQPLAIARQQQRKGGHADRPTLELPPNSPPIAAHLFLECTETDPDKRPTASKIVEWLRSS